MRRRRARSPNYGSIQLRHDAGAGRIPQLSRRDPRQAYVHVPPVSGLRLRRNSLLRGASILTDDVDLSASIVKRTSQVLEKVERGADQNGATSPVRCYADGDRAPATFRGCNDHHAVNLHRALVSVVKAQNSGAEPTADSAIGSHTRTKTTVSHKPPGYSARVSRPGHVNLACPPAIPTRWKSLAGQVFSSIYDWQTGCTSRLQTKWRATGRSRE